jgi:C_GCAxxG_C_C family probable redox protein
MSGSGKSHWTKKLVESGFRAFHCDDLIEEMLASELKRLDGTKMEVGEWMGFPYEPGYGERESRYLSIEKSVLTEILKDMDNHDDNPTGDLVIDTTGSVIYVGDETLNNLRRLTTVVHLETPTQVQAQMLDAYLKNRRPVLWRNCFSKEPHETNHAALARCYETLLLSREPLYEQWADVTVDYSIHSQRELTSMEFLRVLTMAKNYHATKEVHMDNREVAVSCFKKGFVCSQAILSAYSERFGLNRKLALKISTAFGGGMARMAETCGAVTGALMVIGLKYGRTDIADTQAREMTYRLSEEFIARFTARNNSIVCKGMLGVDIGTPEGYNAAKDKNLFRTQCPKYVEDAAEILDEIL